MFRVSILAVGLSLCLEGQIRITPAPAAGGKKFHVTNLPTDAESVTCSPACSASPPTDDHASDIKLHKDLAGQTLVVYASNGNGDELSSATWVPQGGGGGGRLPGWTVFVGVPACAPNTAGPGNTTACPITVTPTGTGVPTNGKISVSVGGGGTAISCTFGTAPNDCVPASGGGYQLTSSTALVAGQQVVATLTPSDTPLAPSAWYGYVGSDLGIQFTPFPKETQTKISGYFTGPEAGKIKTAIIEVRAGTDVIQGPFTATVQNNTFSYSGSGLSLAEGESVYVHAWKADKANIGDPGELSFPHHQNQPAVTSLYDMGRFKAYFSAGAEMDGSGGSLGTATGFVGVNMDSNILTIGDETSGCFTGTGHTYRSADAGCEENVQRFMLNTYLEAELTQIPISSNSSSSSSSKTASPTTTSLVSAAAAAGNGSGTSGGSTTGTSTSSIEPLKAKGAYVVGGLYAPWVPKFAQWRFRGQRNAFFVGPLANYGFQVPGNNPKGTPAFNVFRSYSGGFRFGHYRMTVRKQTAPELLSYLDVTWGKWENFREAVTGIRGTRLDVAGRYKIPYTILFLGFDANTGPGGSDVRLYAGTRVDISTILGKLLPSTN